MFIIALVIAFLAPLCMIRLQPLAGVVLTHLAYLFWVCQFFGYYVSTAKGYGNKATEYMAWMIYKKTFFITFPLAVWYWYFY